jgi:hypothetical protein
MKRTAKLSLLAGICALTACSTVSVTTDYDRTAPFTNYKTYTLAPPTAGQTLSPASEAALQNSIRTQLATRGVTAAKSGKGDISIVRHVVTNDRVSVQQYTDWGYGTGWPYGYGSYDIWYGAPRTYSYVNEYTEGTLILDAVDNKTRKLVFRGVATAVVGEPEANAKKIEDAVAKMVAALPVKP